MIHLLYTIFATALRVTDDHHGHSTDRCLRDPSRAACHVVFWEPNHALWHLKAHLDAECRLTDG